MLTVAVYQPLPSDPASGPILWITQASEKALEASSLPFVEMGDALIGGDTHKVLDGAVVPIDA